MYSLEGDSPTSLVCDLPFLFLNKNIIYIYIYAKFVKVLSLPLSFFTVIGC